MTPRRKNAPVQLSYPGNDSNLRNNTNVELLACLHYYTTLESFPYEPEAFHKLAISHLNTSINRTFSVEELRARLRYLWENWVKNANLMRHPQGSRKALSRLS